MMLLVHLLNGGLFFGGPVPLLDIDKALVPLPAPPGANITVPSINQFTQNIAQTLYDLAPGAALIMFFYGVFTRLTAGNNETQMARSQTIMTWAILGLIVVELAQWGTNKLAGTFKF